MKNAKNRVKPVIVVVDDDPDLSGAVKEWIETQSYTVLVAKSPKDALDIVYSLTGSTIFLIDYHMPGKSGAGLIPDLQEASQFPTEFIVMTGDERPEVRRIVRRLGAEILYKGSVSGDSKFLDEIFEEIDIAEIRLADKELKDRDTITNALTRKGGETLWVPIWNRAKRDKTPTACIFADVNSFKPINDIYGHPVGDLMLQEIEKAIRQPLRTTDVIVRLGDEFIIILAETDGKNATEIAQRIEKQLEGIKVEVEPGIVRGASVSMGVAVLEAQNLRNIPVESFHDQEMQTEIALLDYNDLVKHADNLMYVAKAEHKGLLYSWRKQFGRGFRLTRIDVFKFINRLRAKIKTVLERIR